MHNNVAPRRCTMRADPITSSRCSGCFVVVPRGRYLQMDTTARWAIAWPGCSGPGHSRTTGLESTVLKFRAAAGTTQQIYIVLVVPLVNPSRQHDAPPRVMMGRGGGGGAAPVENSGLVRHCCCCFLGKKVRNKALEVGSLWERFVRLGRRMIIDDDRR